MWKMIVGQATFQLVVTLVMYFAGAEILGYDRKSKSQMLQLDTVIFNTFVWMQVFNQFNNRRLDNKFNIFEGIHRNQFFIGINILMVGLQVTIIFVGSRAFQITPGGLDGTQWAISIVTAMVCLPWAIVVRLFPDEWFAKITGVVGKPFVIVYRFLAKGWTKIKGVFKKNKKSQKTDEESGSAPAMMARAPTLRVTTAE